MSVTGIASNLWHSATTALSAPKAATLQFSGGASTKPAATQASPASGQNPAQADEARRLTDLRAWLVSHSGATPHAHPGQARAAYAGTSAVGGPAP